MQHVLSTHLFANHRLNTMLVDKIQDAGIPAIEIFLARQHLDYRNSSQLSDLGLWFRSSDLKVHSLHSPMYSDEVWGRTGPTSVINITEPVKSRRILMVDEIKRALEVAETIPFTYLIQHIGVTGEEFEERKRDAAFTCLEEIALFAHPRGVKVLLENTPNAMSTSEALVAFLRMTHLRMGFCFDTGHANMDESVERAFETMKDKILSTHVHDNDGKSDSHLFPFAPGGSINWNQTMGLLRSRPDQYPLVLELKEVPGLAHPLDEVKRIFEKLESLDAKPTDRN